MVNLPTLRWRLSSLSMIVSADKQRRQCTSPKQKGTYWMANLSSISRRLSELEEKLLEGCDPKIFGSKAIYFFKTHHWISNSTHLFFICKYSNDDLIQINVVNCQFLNNSLHQPIFSLIDLSHITNPKRKCWRKELLQTKCMFTKKEIFCWYRNLNYKTHLRYLFSI